MLLLNILILSIITFALGYYWRDLHDMIDKLRWEVAGLWTLRKPDEPTPTGSVIEPGEDDPVAQARREFDETQRRLNKK